MRFNINLATEPYEDSRRFYLVWVSLLAGVLLVTALMAYRVVDSWRDSRETAHRVGELRRRIESLDQQRSTAEAILDRPENRDVRERSRFLNQLIERKAFSWTQVFADLEQVMPPRLQVTAIRPDVKEDRLLLELEVEGEAREPALDLVRRMEGSATFREPQVVAETIDTANNKSQVKFQIVTRYVPEPARPAAKPAAQISQGGQL